MILTRRIAPARGLTLIELVTSMTLMAFLAAGTAAVLFVGTRSIPADCDDGDELCGREDAEAAVANLAIELSCVQGFTEKTETSIGFLMPDRENTNHSHIIRYAWDGPGEPLIRTCDNEPDPGILVESVEYFALEFRSGTAKGGGAIQVESGEATLASHLPIGGTLYAYPIEGARWAAQYFQPSLPEGTISWSITRVFIPAQTNALPLGVTRVKIRKADANGRPTGAVVGTARMYEHSLSYRMLWQTLTFSEITELDTGARYCIVLECESFPISCNVMYENHGRPAAGDWFLTTTNSGRSWTARTNADLVYVVKGRYRTEGPLPASAIQNPGKSASHCSGRSPNPRASKPR